MSLINVLRYARNGVLTPQQVEDRKNLLFTAKACKVAAATLGIFSSVLALQSLAQGNFPLSLPFASYLNYEFFTIADNLEKTLDHPIKEVKLALAKCKSEEAFVRVLSKGAPVMSEIFAYFARRQDAEKAKRAAERPPSSIHSAVKELRACVAQKCMAFRSNRP